MWDYIKLVDQGMSAIGTIRIEILKLTSLLSYALAVSYKDNSCSSWSMKELFQKYCNMSTSTAVISEVSDRVASIDNNWAVEKHHASDTSFRVSVSPSSC